MGVDNYVINYRFWYGHVKREGSIALQSPMGRGKLRRLERSWRDEGMKPWRTMEDKMKIMVERWNAAPAIKKSLRPESSTS